VGERELDLSSPVVMGILNVTPDSFSDGGELGSVEEALDRAERMVAEGAGILDVGGESTRPGAAPVQPREELARVLPVIRLVCSTVSVPVSIDTRHADVALEALAEGASIVNDVSGLRHDRRMAPTVAEAGCALVLSHSRGTPATMRGFAVYDDLLGEVVTELRASLDLALAAGVDRRRILIDPGIGFSKTGHQSLLLLKELDLLGSLGRPILVGPSRKSFIGEITGRPPRERAAGTVAACVVAYLQGARVFRVHDVAPVAQALAVARAIVAAETGTSPKKAQEGEERAI
jgi:dihydropteroate synthase